MIRTCKAVINVNRNVLERRPTLVMLESGSFFFDEKKSGAVVIYLSKHGQLHTTVDSYPSSGNRSVLEWGDDNRVIFLRNQVQLKSEGPGKVVCIDKVTPNIVPRGDASRHLREHTLEGGCGGMDFFHI